MSKIRTCVSLYSLQDEYLNKRMSLKAVSYTHLGTDCRDRAVQFGNRRGGSGGQPDTLRRSEKIRRYSGRLSAQTR